MTRPAGPRWLLPLVAVVGVAGVAALLGAILIAGSAPPVPPQPPRPVPAWVAAQAEARRASDVRWDAEIAARAAALAAVPIEPGGEFRVASEVGDPAVGSAVLAASRRAVPRTLELLGGEQWPQRRPYEVGVVRTRERVREEARRGRWTPPAQILGFAELDTGRIWLTTDDLDDPADVLAAAGPGSMLTLVAAHEAAHQAAARCIEGAASGADWLCEGLAEYVAEQVVTETYPGTDLGAIPHFSRAMRTCRDLLAAGQLPTATDILTGNLDRFEPGTRYALWWAFFRCLAEPPRRDRLHEVIARLKRLPWSPDAESQVLRVFDAVWAADSREGLTRAFHAHVASFAPRWRDSGGRFEVTGTTWSLVGLADEFAHAELSEPAGRAEYAIRGELEILPRGDRIADVRLGGSADRWTVVGFQGGRGVGVWLDTDHPGQERRGKPDFFSAAAPPDVGRPVGFAVRVRPGKLSVELGGAQVLECDTGARDLTGRWGVAATNYTGSRTPTNSAAVWREVRLE